MQPSLSMRYARCLFIALATVFTVCIGYAQSTVRVLVPFGPGGGVDQIARTFANLIKADFDVPLVVLNRPGAGGNTAMSELMRATPDGRTIIFTTSGFLLQPFVTDVPWKGPRDFEPIAIVANSPTAHFVRSDAPWKTLQELVEYSRKNPQKVSYGATGSNTIAVLRYIHLRELTGVEWTPIAFTGDAQVVVATLGGHVTTGAAGLGGVTPHVRSGAIRLLAVPEEERVPAFPDIPTFKELGYPLVYPNYVIVVAPKGTPPERLRHFRIALEKATASEEYRRFVDTAGIVPVAKFGADLTAVLDAQFDQLKTYAPKMAR